jgi:hypothetical protein
MLILFKISQSTTTSDDYVTMLYNDEIHSYDQVVNTLKKVLIIDDKKAFEYAAVVDKEGRSAIRRSKKADCLQIKSKIEVIYLSISSYFFFLLQ